MPSSRGRPTWIGGISQRQGANAHGHRRPSRLFQSHSQELRIHLLILFHPGRNLISRRIICTDRRFSRDHDVVSRAAFKMQSHAGVLSDMRQATAFRFREAVGQERCVRFIPHKRDRQRLWHACFINRGQPNEEFFLQPTRYTLAGWRGGIGCAGFGRRYYGVERGGGG